MQNRAGRGASTRRCRLRRSAACSVHGKLMTGSRRTSESSSDSRMRFISTSLSPALRLASLKDRLVRSASACCWAANAFASLTASNSFCSNACSTQNRLCSRCIEQCKQFRGHQAMQMALNSAACRIDIADACQKSWCGYIDSTQMTGLRAHLYLGRCCCQASAS